MTNSTTTTASTASTASTIIETIVIDSTFESATVTDSKGSESIMTFGKDSTLIDKCNRLESMINSDSTTFELDTDTLEMLDTVTTVIVLNSMLKSGIEQVKKIKSVLATAKKTGTKNKKPSAIKSWDSLMNNIINLGIDNNTVIDTNAVLKTGTAFSWYHSNNCLNKIVKSKDKKTGKTVDKEVYKGTLVELAKKYHAHIVGIDSSIVLTRLETVLSDLLETVKTEKFQTDFSKSVLKEVEKSETKLIALQLEESRLEKLQLEKLEESLIEDSDISNADIPVIDTVESVS